MFDGKFRAPVDAAVKPLGAALRKTRMTPEHLTLIATFGFLLLLMPVAVYLAMKEPQDEHR